MRLAKWIALATCLITHELAAQSESVVFEGRPQKRAEAAFEGVLMLDLAADDAFKYQVRIVQRGERFFWASREMRELVRRESGAYVTYLAVDGSGYVRTGTPFMLDLRDRLPEEQRKREIGYTEHLLIGYQSITYFGNRTSSR